MQKEKASNVLPPDFDGVFRFTNSSEEEFTGRWGGKSYTYPAMKTTPMIVLDATPLEIQSIRKKFAREFAEREFFKSKEAKKLTAKPGELNSIHQANSYSDNDLQPWIQKCLEPLEVGRATVEEVDKVRLEDVIPTNVRFATKGVNSTRAVGGDESLEEQAKQAGTL